MQIAECNNCGNICLKICINCCTIFQVSFIRNCINSDSILDSTRITGRDRLGLIPAFSIGDVMKIMTQQDFLDGIISCQNIDCLADKIINDDVSLIALHNVTQSTNMEPATDELLVGRFLKDADFEIHMDNVAALLACSLRRKGKSCSWIWIPHNRLNESKASGTAFLSIDHAIRCIDRFSIPDAVANTVLGIQIDNMEDWFYCLSMESWNHPGENFLSQWKILNGCITSKRLCGRVWLLGDFRITDSENIESRDCMIAGGWKCVNYKDYSSYKVWRNR